VRLLQQIHRLQDARWQHAVFGRGNRPGVTGASHAVAEVRFAVQACGLGTYEGGQTPEEPAERSQRRKYRRTRESLGPRTYRTRVDPFATMWETLEEWLQAQPERTAKSILEELPEHNPGIYPPGQLRTLQRRGKEWRAQAILVFNADGLEADVSAEQTLPQPLQAVNLGSAAG